MTTPRIRVFAGPNGSGKTTLINKLQDLKLPLYRIINPDEIERQLNTKRGLTLSDYGIRTRSSEFLRFVQGTTYSAEAKRAAWEVRFKGMSVYSRRSRETSYNAALLSAFLRNKLVHGKQSFSYESVFSHVSKVEELKAAKRKGFRIYLYYVATDALEVAFGRVQERVEGGGHTVPKSKIKRRYSASLKNLLPALTLAYRAYIFDNSGREARLIAEKTPQGNLNIQQETLPLWFDKYVIQRLG